MTARNDRGAGAAPVLVLILVGLLAVAVIALVFSMCDHENGPTTTLDSGDENGPTTTLEPPLGFGLAVDSWPSGADVYVMPAVGSIFDAEVDAIASASNLLGTAPIREELPPGSYFVAVAYTASQLTDLGYELPNANDPTYDLAFPSDLSRVSRMSFDAQETISAITKVYEVNVSSRGPETLVSLALPLPVEERGMPTPYIYPTAATVEPLGTSYDFRDDVMRGAIQDNVDELGLSGVDDSLIAEMLDVLRKAGKVRLFTDSDDIIIELGDDSFAVMIFG